MQQKTDQKTKLDSSIEKCKRKISEMQSKLKELEEKRKVLEVNEYLDVIKTSGLKPQELKMLIKDSKTEIQSIIDGREKKQNLEENENEEKNDSKA